MANKRLIDRPHAQLLVIDMQEKLLPVIHDTDNIQKNVERLLQMAAELNIPQTITLQNPSKLGDVPDALADQFRNPVVLTKMAFSAWREKTVEGHLKHSSRQQIILCGVEAHVCVMQTALDLVDKGYQVFVPHDAVGSRSEANASWALQRLQQNGCTIVATESVLFELLVEAGTDEFRNLRKIIL
jgi:isochorismate hydrolase